MKLPSLDSRDLQFCIIALLLAGPALAQTGHFSVTLDTRALIGSAAGPFQVGFQLADGSETQDGNNAVVVSNFQFGGGLPALPVCSDYQNAIGDLSSSISLTDLGYFAICEQGFVPGSTFSFDVAYTNNVDSPGPADEFVMVILDKNSVPIPTAAGVALLQVDFNSANPLIQVFAGDPTQPEAANGGWGIPIPAPTVSGVALPPSIPILLAPTNGATQTSLSPKLTWSTAAGATSYDVFFGSSFPLALATNTTATSFSPGVLIPGTLYYWRVNAKNAVGTTDSGFRSFATRLKLPSKVGVFRPGAFMTAEDANGNIAWDASTDHAFFFGSPGDILIQGDWDGTGTTKLGIFRPGVAMFAIDMNGNGVWDPGIDRVGFFGQSGDVPILGDWTGDGRTKIGIYRPSTALFALDMNGDFYWEAGTDRAGQFGVPGDAPIIGDWTGDGKTKIGIYRASTSLFAVDSNGNLAWDSGTDAAGVFGTPGDVPIVGDWTGDGVSKVGIYRSSSSLWAFDINANLAWDAGTDEAGVFGAPGDVLVLGDWDGSGVTRAGIFRPSVGLWGLDLNGNLAWDTGIDLSGVFGTATDTPLVGKWP
jgi:hypothetical protein